MAKPKLETVGAVLKTTMIFAPASTIKELAKARRDTKQRTQSMAGTLGDQIGDAVEDKHLDRKAFAMACQLEALDDERLHITLHSLFKYLDDLGVIKRATAQEELFTAGEAGEPIAKITDAKPKAAKDKNAAKAAAKPKNGSAKGRSKNKEKPTGAPAREVAETAGDEFGGPIVH